jgi:hypothetical protein
MTLSVNKAANRKPGPQPGQLNRLTPWEKIIRKRSKNKGKKESKGNVSLIEDSLTFVRI